MPIVSAIAGITAMINGKSEPRPADSSEQIDSGAACELTPVAGIETPLPSERERWVN